MGWNISFRPDLVPGAGGVSLSWTAPTLDESGQSMTPAGYLLYAGQNPGEVRVTYDLPSPGATTYLWNDPAFVSGSTWYFMIRAYSSSGAYSILTDPVSKVVP